MKKNMETSIALPAAQAIGKMIIPHRGFCLLVLWMFLTPFLVPHALSQEVAAAPRDRAGWTGLGDAPDDPGPLATDLSPKLTRAAVDKVVHKVADWQLQRARSFFSQDWTFSALYPGLMAASRVLAEPSYENAMLEVGEKYNWELGPRWVDPTYVDHHQPAGQTYDANDQLLALTYVELYQLHHDAAMIAPTKRQFDQVMTEKDNPNPSAPRWWWCDALFMAAPSWVGLYQATGNRAYLDYMDREWWATSAFLYDPQEHLYFRDSNFFARREKNGQKLFWSRGNGWVMAGLAQVLEGLPKDYPSRSKYVMQYKEMAARVASLQGSDGLWSPGLLDRQSYEQSETSGSGFFIYSLAWGVDHGILSRKVYMPVIRKGWAGLVSHVYADGRIGGIQPIASGPGNFKASSSYVYGVGAFLLAGSEVHELAVHSQGQQHTVQSANR
jgi:rhamnogalacturonyl hydrolase YesR